jgi:phosphatidate cytidylyltransferase
MLKQRLITAAVLIPLLLGAMFLLPGFWWQLLLLIPVWIAAHEWSRLAAFGRAGEAALMLVVTAAIGLLMAVATTPESACARIIL